MKALDLFAGVGGITLGFHAAGIETKAAIEIDKSCAETFPLNFPDIDFYSKSVSDFSNSDISQMDFQDVDIINGGPPCQGFSLIGLRDPNDERSKLVFEFRRYVQVIRPKYFIMENVPGMLSAEKGKWIEQLISQLEGDGYSVSDPIILNASEFGAPQNRRRVFLFGTRKDLNFHLNAPPPTHWSPRVKYKGDEKESRLKFVSVREAISDLPVIDKYNHLVDEHEVEYEAQPQSAYAKMMRGRGPLSDFFGKVPKNWNHKVCSGCKRVVHGEVLKKRFAETKCGDNVPISRLYKLKWDDVANTLRAGTPSSRGSYSSPRPVHPEQNRCICVREGARLQGFPDWFQFHPTKWHGFRQIGNSVSPLVSKAVAEEVVKVEAQQHLNFDKLAS